MNKAIINTLMCGAAIAAVTGCKQVTQNDTKRPNILIILTDDQGYGDLGCLYAKDMRTPVLDKLFADGVQMDNFYSNSSLSSPARASLMTGCNPDIVGVQGVMRNELPGEWYANFGYLSQSAVLMPQVLKKYGYSTALIGKWHLGYTSPNTPNEKGFDLFKGILGGMMDDYYTHLRRGFPALRINDKVAPPVEGHISDVLSDWAVDYINDQTKKGKPFFLFLSYNAPHFPLHAPEDWIEMVKQREPGISHQRARLVALIEHMDAGIGRVFDALVQTGAMDNTLIMFTADNGGDRGSEANCGPHRGFKHDLLEGGIKVPCAFYLKGVIENGQSQNVAQFMDVLPTICDLLEVKAPKDVEGISILPTLKGEPQVTNDRFLWWMFREFDLPAIGMFGNKMVTAVRYGDMKLVQNRPDESYALYDLSNDPAELNSLPLEGELHDAMRKFMRERINMAGVVPWNMPKDKYVSWDEMNAGLERQPILDWN